MGALQSDERGVLTTCPACGKGNRLSYARLNKAARCGECGAALASPGFPVDVPSVAVFDALVRDSALPVVVDFWAPWCGPCRMVAPEMDEVARKTAGEFLVIKVDTDTLPELGERFRIRSIPTMAVFHGGREITRTAGARPAADIEAFVRQALHVTASP